MKKLLAALAICAFATPALAGQHWGSFKDNGCVRSKGAKYHVYSSVLWGIPWGASWEVACAKMPATVHGFRFGHPTACVKTGVVDAMGITAAVLSFPGLVYPPAGVAGAVVGGAAIALDKSNVGAINMWGVFYVKNYKC